MNPGLFTHKVGAAAAAARRSGALQAVDAMNHFFLNHEMYDLGQNMAFLLKALKGEETA